MPPKKSNNSSTGSKKPAIQEAYDSEATKNKSTNKLRQPRDQGKGQSKIPTTQSPSMVGKKELKTKEKEENALKEVIKNLPIVGRAMTDAKELQQSKEAQTKEIKLNQENKIVVPEDNGASSQTPPFKLTDPSTDIETGSLSTTERHRKSYHMYNVENKSKKQHQKPTSGDTGRRTGVRDYNLNKVLEERYRTPWRRDYARVIHSPAFRRLQGKTQLFSTPESDYFRNRLTHSLEVAQIAKSIAIRLNSSEKALKSNRSMRIDPDLVEIAGLCHDLGHPPFAHDGEEALNECMRDFGGFEGNAQTLRILAVLEKRYVEGSRLKLIDVDKFISKKDKVEIIDDMRRGLNLCYRTLASVIKYDKEISTTAPSNNNTKKILKGYYECDAEIVKLIKDNVNANKKSKLVEGQFKTIECSIMDLADDIAYSTYDLEDSFKAGFLSPLELLSADDEIVTKVAETIIERCECLVCKCKKAIKEQKTKNGNTELEKIVEFNELAKFIEPTERTEFTKLIESTDFTESTEFEGGRPKFKKMKDCGHGHKDRCRQLVKNKIRELWKQIVFRPMFIEPDSEPKSAGSNAQPNRSDPQSTNSNLVMIAHGASTLLSKDGYYRVGLVSELIGYFIRKTRFHYNEVRPYFSEVYLDPEDAVDLEILKNFTYESVIRSPRFRILRNRSREIVKAIFDRLASENGYEMLPDDARKLYATLKDAEEGLKAKKDMKAVAEEMNAAAAKMMVAAMKLDEQGNEKKMKEQVAKMKGAAAEFVTAAGQERMNAARRVKEAAEEIKTVTENMMKAVLDENNMEVAKIIKEEAEEVIEVIIVTIKMMVLKNAQMRIICDFIASMTDRYAFEFHARLNSENAETVFKPL